MASAFSGVPAKTWNASAPIFLSLVALMLVIVAVVLFTSGRMLDGILLAVGALVAFGIGMAARGAPNPAWRDKLPQTAEADPVD